MQMKIWRNGEQFTQRPVTLTENKNGMKKSDVFTQIGNKVREADGIEFYNEKVKMYTGSFSLSGELGVFKEL